MTQQANAITYVVRNRLGKLLHRPGGIGREEAVAAALDRIETLRGEYVGAIPCKMQTMERIVSRKTVTAEEIDELLKCAEGLLVLSNAFGFPLLETIVKSLCDLGIGMREKGITAAEPLRVHVRALRLFCPEASPPTEEDVERVLTELSKIHKHFSIS